jgi:hypothetical protein
MPPVVVSLKLTLGADRASLLAQAQQIQLSS